FEHGVERGLHIGVAQLVQPGHQLAQHDVRGAPEGPNHAEFALGRHPVTTLTYAGTLRKLCRQPAFYPRGAVMTAPATAEPSTTSTRVRGEITARMPEHFARLDWPVERLRAHQTDRLRALLVHATKHS